MSLCNLNSTVTTGRKTLYFNPICIHTNVIYLGKGWDSLICRFKERVERVAALGRTDDIQFNKVEMTSLLTPYWLSTCKTGSKCMNFNFLMICNSNEVSDFERRAEY